MIFFNAFPSEGEIRDIKSNTCKLSVFQCESQEAKDYGD